MGAPVDDDDLHFLDLQFAAAAAVSSDTCDDGMKQLRKAEKTAIFFCQKNSSRNGSMRRKPIQVVHHL